jgi:two-component sensor histidine kinase
LSQHGLQQKETAMPMSAQSEARNGSALEQRLHPLTLSQLRHHTRNTLQRVIMEVHEHSATCDSSRERRLLSAVTDRIMHSVAIADALFGITHGDVPFPDRLRAICRSTVALLASPDQNLATEVTIEGVCPSPLEVPVLRAAQEFLGNAVKHGMRMRLVGHIRVSLVCAPHGALELVVRDDGWGPHPSLDAGEGLILVGELAALLHGAISLTREQGETLARLTLPATHHG